MSEVAWRVASELRDLADRGRIAAGWLPPAPKIEGAAGPPFRVSDVAVGEWAAPGAGAAERRWLERLRTQAGAIARHRLSFFDLEERHLGDPIDWNRDHKSGRAAPLGFAASIDYRDFSVTGDAKFVWEPSRHHQLVVLGRAYRASGDRRFAEALVEQLGSWLDQSPYGRGMNWRSPLELAIRLINWTWALDLIRESGLLAGELQVRVVRAVQLQLRDITRKYSRGSSANNHKIGEAAGVYVASAYFPGLDRGGAWRRESRQILIDEIAAQTHPDGANREQALGYHLFVLQFFLAAGMVGRWIGEEFPSAYWSSVERMLGFVAALAEGGRELPMLGDADDGYVLDLGGVRGDHRGLLSVGAALFARGDLRAGAEEEAEPVRWLLGRAGMARFDGAAAPGADAPLRSRAFPDCGLYLLQCGRRGTRERVSVLFDCGDLGFGALAAHGHADALGFTLRAFGVDVLVDPGTYDYFTFPSWREYFRSTRAHNTVVVDGLDQSTKLGPFLWGQRAVARCLRWAPAEQGGVVSGEHDGYTRLPAPLVHRRTLDLDAARRTLTVRDELAGRGSHEIAVCFHLSEHCVVTREGPGQWRVQVGGGAVTLVPDPALDVQAIRASEVPEGGWVSRGYHRKAPATTLVGRCRQAGDLTLVCRIEVGPAS